MKKTKLTRSLLAAVSIVALTAVLYGCTGDDGVPQTTHDQEVEDKEKAKAEAAELREQINALRAQLGLDADDDLGDSIAELQTTLTDLKKQIDDAQDEKDKMAAEAASKEALALFKSFLDTLANDNTPEQLTVSEVTVTDTHDGGGSAEISATLGHNGAGATPVADVEATDTEISMLGMWQGTELAGSNTAETVSSTVVVYTDIKADKRVAIEKSTAYMTRLAATTDGVGILTWTAGDEAQTAAPSFSTSGLKIHGESASATDEVITVPGSLAGAMGEWRCTESGANSCTSLNTDDGIVLTTAWTFDPNTGATISQADAAYAYFGWWLHKDSAGPEVDMFHGSNHATAVDGTRFNALDETVTYKGAAAGKYAMNRGADHYAMGGHWTANATLTADLTTDGDTEAGAGAGGSISGMIYGFMAGGKAMDWSVKLNTAPIAITPSAADFTLPANGTVWTIGGAKADPDGQWSGSFHEQIAPAAGGNDVPTTVTGEFTATYGLVGHMTGAFGARVEE